MEKIEALEVLGDIETLNKRDIHIKLTNHVKERYAERIMGRDTKGEVNIFIAQNEAKINTDIENMVRYGEVIFEGTQLDGKTVRVYRSDTWVVIVDSKNNSVITLYRIELGAGIELDRLYVQKMVEQLETYKTEEEESTKQVEEDNKQYKSIIDELEAQIVDYRKAIKEMEKLVVSYKDTIQSSNARTIAIKEKRSAIINKLLSKKHF